MGYGDEEQWPQHKGYGDEEQIGKGCLDDENLPQQANSRDGGDRERQKKKTGYDPEFRRRERGGRHIRLAEKLADAIKAGKINEAELHHEEQRYIEWSRRMHARIWRAHGCLEGM